MKPFFIKTRDSITVLLDGAPYTVAADHPRYAELGTSIDKANWGDVADIVRAKAKIVEGARKFGNVEVFGGHITFRGAPLVNYLADRILEIQAEGVDPEPMAMFLDKAMENPDPRAQRDLYRWCEAGGLPLATDGDIIAYKIINLDWTDVHTGKMDNSVGAVVEQNRELCDPDPNVTCSHGLHFCSAGYLPRFGQFSSNRRVVLVKINPRDVVAFPTDYGLAKGRACRYLIAQEIDREKANTFFHGFKGYYEVPTPAPAPEPVEVAVAEDRVLIKHPTCGFYLARDEGYTDEVANAYRYTREDAEEIVDTDADGTHIVELPKVTADEQMVFVMSSEGRYWKAPSQGTTEDITEAHSYPLSEVKGYGGVRFVEAVVPEPAAPPASAFEVHGFPVGTKVRVKQDVNCFTSISPGEVLTITDCEMEHAYYGFALFEGQRGCVRVENTRVGKGHWYPIGAFEIAPEDAA